MKIKIVEPIRKNGTLVGVILKLEEPKDIGIYRSFLKSEPAMCKCAHCGNPVNIEDIEPVIQVDSPLTPGPMCISEPIVRCPKCNERITGISMLDYSAFPSVMAFLRELRAKAAAKKAGVGNGK